MADLTRSDVRFRLTSSGLYNPTEDQIVLLHGHIARELIKHQGMRDTLRVGKLKKREILVKSYYFHDRQGVTFGRDGWVGIAGWADDTNVQPFLRALIKWEEEVTGYVNP